MYDSMAYISIIVSLTVNVMPILPPVIALCGVGYALLSTIDYTDWYDVCGVCYL